MTSPISNALEQLVPPGTVVGGKYRVDRLIGVGGMGIVVEAWHLDFDERVAIKFLSPSLCTNAEAVARFEREARALFKIKSPHVCRVLDIGRLEAGSPFLVLEFLEGEDLAVRLTHRTASSVQDAVDWMVQACDAVGEAHARGIVHRDIKPENLFLAKSADGNARIKVLDFGLSKVAAPSGGERQRTLTATEQAMGTPHYMSPEQWMSARDVGPSTDQWSLAVILYELLSGLPPFDGEQLPQVCTAVLHAPVPSLVARAPGVPRELETAIVRALAKAPEDRFPNLGQLAKALAPFGRSESRAIAERIARMFDQAESLLQSTELARISASSLAAIRNALPGAMIASPRSSRPGAVKVASPSEPSSTTERAAANAPSAEDASGYDLTHPATGAANGLADDAPTDADETAPRPSSADAAVEKRVSEPSSIELDLESDAIVIESPPAPPVAASSPPSVRKSLPKTTIELKTVPRTAALPFVSPPPASDAAGPGLRKRSQTAQSWQTIRGDRPSRPEPNARKVGLISFGVALAIFALIGWLAGPRVVAAMRGAEIPTTSVAAPSPTPSTSAAASSAPEARPASDSLAASDTPAIPSVTAATTASASPSPSSSAAASRRPVPKIAPTVRPSAPKPAPIENPKVRPPLPVPPRDKPATRPKRGGGSIFDDR